MNEKYFLRVSILTFFAFAVACGSGARNSAVAQSKPSIHQTTLEELNQPTPEVSTEELKKLLLAGAKPVPVIDTRSAMEYAIAHIPGSINLWEKEAEYIIKAYPDKEALMVLYCNGPY
jgi:hypothetical protein